MITTVTVSGKGQIAIPVSLRAAAKIKEGDVLLVSEHNGKILLERTENLSKKYQQEIRELEYLSARSMNKIWDNASDNRMSEELARKHKLGKTAVYGSFPEHLKARSRRVKR